MAHHVTSTEEYYQLLNDHPGVIVDYYATWCKPCTAISPKIDEFQAKYPSIKFLKVNYDEFDDIITDEKVEKLPTFKAFYKKEQMALQIGVKLDELEAIIIDINNRVNPNAIIPTSTSQPTTTPPQQTATSPTSSISPPAAHPALAVQDNATILKGSKQFTHIKPSPPELAQFLSTLTSTHNIILFSHRSQHPSSSTTTTSPTKSSSSTSTSNNIVTQVVNDLKLLSLRFSTDTNQINFEHIIIDDNDQYTTTLAEEYGCENISKLPIVKMMWKKQVYATIINGNAFDVEAKLPEFMQL